MTDLTPCPRCGYDRDRDEQRKLLLGHLGHRLRAVLYVTAGELGLIWVCERCHAPAEAILKVEKRSAGLRRAAAE
jgi:hypothetical protein